MLYLWWTRWHWDTFLSLITLLIPYCHCHSINDTWSFSNVPPTPCTLSNWYCRKIKNTHSLSLSFTSLCPSPTVFLDLLYVYNFFTCSLPSFHSLSLHHRLSYFYQLILRSFLSITSSLIFSSTSFSHFLFLLFQFFHSFLALFLLRLYRKDQAWKDGRQKIQNRQDKFKLRNRIRIWKFSE